MFNDRGLPSLTKKEKNRTSSTVVFEDMFHSLLKLPYRGDREDHLDTMAASIRVPIQLDCYRLHLY